MQRNENDVTTAASCGSFSYFSPPLVELPLTGIGLRFGAADGVASQSHSLNVFLSQTHEGFCKSAEFSNGDLQKL